MNALAIVLAVLAQLHVPTKPCPSEDTVPRKATCYWDAEHRGNGQGHSFVVFKNGSIIRVS